MAQAAGPLAVGAGIVKGIGQLAQGAGEAEAYQYNARTALQQEGVALSQSYTKAGAVERQVSQTEGAEKAAYGHAGVSPSLWMLADTAHQGELSRQLQLYQGRADAAAQEREADIQHAQATAARTGSYIGAAGTVLGSIATAATM
jgi:hypothetical protein